MNKLYVQYGCGPFSAPEGWKNFDSSPTLRVQQWPLIGSMLRRRMHVAFPREVLLGDILKQLPGIGDNSCDGVYCSHVLEHLSYDDCVIAVRNTYRILKPGGRFRCVVPDLESAARDYMVAIANNDIAANTKFLEATMLGKRTRLRGWRGILQTTIGNRDHLYMWDRLSLTALLQEVGFSHVRPCSFNDSTDMMFSRVEDETRFQNAVALEAIK
ncbi:methyltransferase domain-containing protein [Chitinophaga pendula]|uniref:class I SAM-dependent methyltransferase n=1 Tax=Chitinophaga TaxID=79328 RepID=UPI000BAF6CFE|nr:MULTISPECIES: methyltransferase domain-containing protein [Chitinophaga]ASZ15121.1 methyltransferase type 11 [Chitinophaga sp. MD30]UCJ08168.1 methyltransferase domain-containing protein [Chitinophaga pendula]